MPNSEVPGLFEIAVMFFVPARRSAAIKFSGMPQTPKPPIMIEAPSVMRLTATSALATVLSIRFPVLHFNAHSNANCEAVYRRRWRRKTPLPVRAAADARAGARLPARADPEPHPDYP